MPVTTRPQITSNMCHVQLIFVLQYFEWLQLASGHVVKPHDPFGDQEACTSNVGAINNVLQGLRICGAANCEVRRLLWMENQNGLQMSAYLAPTTNAARKIYQAIYQAIYLNTSSSGDWRSEVLQSEPSICQVREGHFMSMAKRFLEN